MGHYCCDTILDYCDPDQSKVATALRELQLLFPARGTASSATAPEDDSCVSLPLHCTTTLHTHPHPSFRSLARSDGSDFGDTTESDAKRKLKRRGKRSAKASKSAKSSASGSNGSARRGRNKGTTPSNSSGRRRSDATAARVGAAPPYWFPPVTPSHTHAPLSPSAPRSGAAGRRRAPTARPRKAARGPPARPLPSWPPPLPSTLPPSPCRAPRA